MCRKTLWGQKGRGCHPVINGTNFPRSPCTGICLGWKMLTHMAEGPKFNQVWETKQNDWPKGNKRPRRLPPSKWLKLAKGTALSELVRLCSAFLRNFLLSSLPSVSLSKFFQNTGELEPILKPLAFVVQWLGSCAVTSATRVWSPTREMRSHFKLLLTVVSPYQ